MINRIDLLKVVLLACCLMFNGLFMNGQSSIMKSQHDTMKVLYSARGKGQTTGHIADLTVTNNSDQPIQLAHHRWDFYLASRDGFQSYVGRILPTAVIPPGATVPATRLRSRSDVRGEGRWFRNLRPGCPGLPHVIR